MNFQQQRTFDFNGAPVAVDEAWHFEDRLRVIRAQLLRCARLGEPVADSPWFALQVMTGREKAVENVLTAEKIECCVPTRKGREVRRRGRIMAHVMPVLVGYVLVRCERSPESFFALLGVEHVLGILGGWQRPHRVSDEEVRIFKEKAEAGAFDGPHGGRRLKKGDQVIVNDGPLAGLEGRVAACRSDACGDVVVELCLLGRITRALVPLAILDGV